MNTKFFASALFAAATLAAVPAFAAGNDAGEVGYFAPAATASTSGVTRATVQNEYLQALRSGSLPQVGEGADLGAVVATGSTLTRQAVRAEAAYALQHGQARPGLV